MRMRLMGKLFVSTVGAIVVVALALASSAHPTPPGGNGLIAFVTGEGIAVIRSDGTGLRQLTHHIGDRAPAWSPDGRLLALERAGRIYVMKADGTGLHRLGSRPPRDHEPAWSPDGRRIAFVTKDSLLVMRADGGGVRRLYRIKAGAVAGPSWSPDGRSIAFSLVDEDVCGEGSLAVIGEGGRGLRYVTLASGCPPSVVAPGGDADVDDSDPDWSPDGTRIAFTRLAWFCESCDQKAIFTSSVDGSDVRWVTTDTSLESSRPSWSPNQKRLVAETSNGIAILDLAGKRLRILNHGTEPAWQPLRR
jgi:Tol biopolymer transport system component